MSRALLATLLVAGAPLAASAASSGVTTLYAFTAGNPYQEDELPHGKFLYGTTNVGGAKGYGTLYKLGGFKSEVQHAELVN